MSFKNLVLSEECCFVYIALNGLSFLPVKRILDQLRLYNGILQLLLNIKQMLSLRLYLYSTLYDIFILFVSRRNFILDPFGSLLTVPKELEHDIDETDGGSMTSKGKPLPEWKSRVLVTLNLSRLDVSTNMGNVMGQSV